MGKTPGKKHKIALVGPFPPPYGGISVHIQRMIRLLPENSFDLYNTSKISHPDYFRFYGKIKFLKALRFMFMPYRLIHVHATDNILRMVFGFIGLFKKNIYIHLHGMSHLDFLEAGHPGGWLLRKLIPGLHILAVNGKIAERVTRHMPASVRIVDAFLPPVLEKKSMDNALQLFGKNILSGRFVISMTGWFSSYQNADLYGFDMAARLVIQLKGKGQEAILLVCMNGVRDKTVYSGFLDLIKAGKIEDQVIVIENEAEAWPYMLLSDVFIRPTNTDGSSVSVNEAIWLNVPVIASDCVKRPEEVILFKNRDQDDLLRKVISLKHPEPVDPYSRMEKAREKDFTCSIINDVYGITSQEK